MLFAELKQKALAEWQALEQGNKPRILVGTATCGRASGALNVLTAIREKVSSARSRQ